MYIERELSTYFSEAMDAELPDLVVRERRLRVSGFPYCGLQHAYEKLDNIQHLTTTSGKEFYTSVGTAAHLVFQRWMGMKGRIWGDWKCYNPKCKHEVKFSKVSKCPKCGHEMEYEEFTVKRYKHVSGHLDGVYEDDFGKLWVIDYKTSSVRVIASQKKEPTFPYAKNRVQIMSYCALIEKMYNVKIAGWALLYIARDDPFYKKVVADKVTDEQKRKVLKKIKSYDRLYELVENINTQEQLDYVIEKKACKCETFYNEFMAGFKGCPLAGICFTKQLPTFMTDLFNDWIEDQTKPKKGRKAITMKKL